MSAVPVSKSHHLQCRTAPLAQCKSSSRMFCCTSGVPGDSNQKSTASGQCDKTSYTFLLRCRHALRLQCTERDGVTSPLDSYTESLRLLNTHGVPSSSTVRRSIIRFLLRYRQALCVHRDVTRFLLWCGMDRSRTSFQILKLSNRVERELMGFVPSSRFSSCLCSRLRRVQRVRSPPLRCTLLVHQHAPRCPTTPSTMYGRGCLLPTPSWTQRVLQVLTRLTYGLRRTGC